MATINLKNVSLDFPLTKHKLKKKSAHKIFNPATGGVVSTSVKNRMSIRALEDISLSLKPGDSLALLGHNGAGKTTLLRVMAGLYAPTHGEVSIKGRVAPLLNLSFGIDMEATGFDNIWTRGLYLGMSRAEIKNKIDEIADFSGLDEFLSLPIRTYSSGMKARLAFAISTHVEADILLLDEVVATGDASFFQQANRRIEEFCSQSKIMVLASHSNKMLRNLCNKGMLLEHGKIKAFGPINEVIDEYEAKSSMQPLFSNRSEIPLNKEKNSNTVSKQKTLTRILLVNDTGNLPNPGCRAVRKAYKLLFDQHIEQTVINASIPVNYWIKHFREICLKGSDAVIKQSGSFTAPVESVSDVDISEWEKIRLSLTEKDLDLKNALNTCDVVVINGEGSIHHNSVRTLSILALAKTAIEAGKKTLLLNSTIQAVMPELLQDVLSRLDFIHVREQASQDYLKKLNIGSHFLPDLAFYALEEESIPKLRLLDAKIHVLVTGGVLIDEDGLNNIFDAVESIKMRSVYLSIGDGGETSLARKICEERDIPMVEAKKIGVKELIGFIKQFKIGISGRHHINIFMMRAGLPFLPLSSNTWKIEETLKAVNYPLKPIMSYADLAPALAYMSKNLEELSIASSDSYLIGNKLISNLPELIHPCIR